MNRREANIALPVIGRVNIRGVWPKATLHVQLRVVGVFVARDWVG